MCPPSHEEQPLHASDQQHRLAKVRFHRALARAHEDYADSILSLGDLSDDAPDTPALRGSLQRGIVALKEMTTDRGMTSREVAAATTGDEPNCHTALKGLAEKKVVEVVDGSSPQRFRLTSKHRRNRVLRLSRLIGRGEWTTYGDFAIAVYENPRMGRTVGQVAAHHPAFANPHRVVRAGGIVSPEWRDEDNDLGPEECKRRLTVEGAWDADADCALEGHFVNWEELRNRLTADEATSGLDAAA
jgi:alkylated DNA nucleotide flippase Atl1